MDKFVIIGPSGAGKTTLAKNLGTLLAIKVYHLDRFFWQRDWKGISGDRRVDILQNIVLRDKRWIMEGNYIASSKPRLEAADIIIFLDLPPLRCLWRIIFRHIICPNTVRRRDIPEGCKDKLTLSRMVKVLLFPFREHKRLEKILRQFETTTSKQIIRLHSPEEVQAFLAQPGQLANKSAPVSTAKEKKLITV